MINRSCCIYLYYADDRFYFNFNSILKYKSRVDLTFRIVPRKWKRRLTIHLSEQQRFSQCFEYGWKVSVQGFSWGLIIMHIISKGTSSNVIVTNVRLAVTIGGYELGISKQALCTPTLTKGMSFLKRNPRTTDWKIDSVYRFLSLCIACLKKF